MKQGNMKSAIITGATGTIGTALTALLASKGIEVLVLTRADSGRNHRILKHPLVTVKECDYGKLQLLENDTGHPWDCFFHFAWAGAAGRGRNDMLLQNHNVEVALHAVETAKRFGCRKFIGAGSQAEYGRSDRKLTPDSPTFPENGYGYAKLCAGKMTRDYAHQLGMAQIWLRVLSVFGLNDGVNSMIAQTMISLKKGESLDYSRGEQIWDYVYNKDAARAFFAAAENGADGRVYLLSSGQERPLKDYLIAIRDRIAPGVELKLGARPYAENQMMYLAGDCSLLMKETGYAPKFTFEQGIEDMKDFNPLD